MSAVRFNPPPGWHLPPGGGVPAAEWRPDTEPPPTPPGWPFYLDQRGRPVGAPPGAWVPADVERGADSEPDTPNAEPDGADSGPSPGRHRSERRSRRWSMLLVGAGLSIAVVVAGALSLLG